METVANNYKLAVAAMHLAHNWGGYELSFTWMGTKKALSKEQKAEMAEQFDADAAWLSGSKKLLDTKDKAWKRLTAAKRAIKEFWFGNSLPWPKDGVRLVKRSTWDTVEAKMFSLRDELNAAVCNLDCEMERLIRKAQTSGLGKTFNRDDYPPTVIGLFSVDWEPINLEPPEYLASEHPELYAEQSARIASRFDEAARLAEEGFIQTFAKCVQGLLDKLSGDEDGQPKRLQETHVANLREFFETFRRLNIHTSEDLDRAVEQAEAALTSGGLPLGKDDLRDSSLLRQSVATKLSAAMASVEGLMVNIPRRSITRRGEKQTAK